MIHFIVTPKNGQWSNWQELAKQAQIILPQGQQELAEELMLKNGVPEPQEELLYVVQNYSPSYPAEEFNGFGSATKAIHPIIMLTMLASIDEKMLEQWEYTELVSSYLLADKKGRIFYFYFTRNWEGRGERAIMFKLAEQRVYRCMYAWGYEKGTRFCYKQDERATRLPPA